MIIIPVHQPQQQKEELPIKTNRHHMATWLRDSRITSTEEVTGDSMAPVAAAGPVRMLLKSTYNFGLDMFRPSRKPNGNVEGYLGFSGLSWSEFGFGEKEWI